MFNNSSFTEFSFQAEPGHFQAKEAKLVEPKYSPW